LITQEQIMASRRARKVLPAAKVAADTVVVNGIRYMTMAEYAAWKHVSYWTVRRAKLRGEIKSERIGKSDRIPVRVA
jgi:hypothetical protein